ncbi:hypothetical protein [Catenuloplanes atrovinosus]|uniref:Uncharacterized protein n=1 Tax=Catenuloplanes atrovinosus TaxID=137266 RepID=A0AAE3YL09_9ACTN|nr:hypothetical protein [Catenuloplanes atrovinosus]MDR7275764.1 hypothetical protein [Catenuloplanes atrovinosus]
MTADWWELRHAYGRATDTPAHLRALESDDAEAHAAALDHLDVAVLHQGFPDSATAPAVRAVTELLAAGRAHPDTVEGLLEFLGDAARSAADVTGSDYFAVLLPELRETVAAAYPVALALLDAVPPDRTVVRASQLVEMARIANPADGHEHLMTLLRDLATRDPGPRERWVHCLARLGADLRALFSDPDPAVRLRAALTHAAEPHGRELIRAALAAPLPAGVYRGELVRAAIRNAPDIDSIATEAADFIGRDDWTGFDDGWGALVSFAFPERSEPLTGTRRRILWALAGNDDQEIWNPGNGSCRLVFTRAGLPHDRGACRRLADDVDR